MNNQFLMKSIFPFLILFFIAGISNIQAQKDTNYTYTENVIVVGEYDPSLMIFPKIKTNPVINDSGQVKQELKYNIFPQPLKTHYETKEFNAAKMSGEAFDELYGNYIKAGVGTSKTIYGEIFLNSKRDKKRSVGLHLKHFSMDGKIEEYASPENSDNEAELYYSMFRKKSSFHATAFFERDALHYYGFKPSEMMDTLEKEDYRQRYCYTGAKLKWQSSHTDSSHTNFKVNLKYAAFWDLENNLDHNINLRGTINKRVRWIGFSKYQEIGIKTENYHVFSSRNFGTYNAGAINVTPYISTNLGLIFIELGANLAMDVDSSSNSKIYPHLQIDLNLLPGTITAFGGIDGHIEYNSYYKLAQMNPFIHPMIENNHSFIDRELYGGIRGNISKVFSYSIQAKQRNIKNHPLFINDTLTYMGNWFGVVTDDINWFRGQFDATLNIKNKWIGRILFAYNEIDAVNEVEAWHIPQFEGSIGLGYNIADKILINANIFVFGQRWARQETTAGFIALKLDPIIDANLSIEYRYSKVLSAYLQFNNIAAQKYMLWNQYPSYRFQFMGGVTYAF